MDNISFFLLIFVSKSTLMYILALLTALAFISILAIFVQKKSAKPIQSHLDKIIDKDAELTYNVIYPSLGIEIKSNILFKAPVSIHEWTIRFEQGKAFVDAYGFWGGHWNIVIDTKKTSLNRYDSDVYQYLIQSNIIEPNENLIE